MLYFNPTNTFSFKKGQVTIVNLPPFITVVLQHSNSDFFLGPKSSRKTVSTFVYYLEKMAVIRKWLIFSRVPEDPGKNLKWKFVF